jgi:hypothetical protein
VTPEEFENLLIAEIESLEIPVRAYPQYPKEYFPEHDPGEVLVRFEGRKPVERDLTGLKITVQYFAEIMVVSRQVRETEGAYDWLQQIYNLLEGKTLESVSGMMTGQLEMNVESFMDETNGTWQFGQKWSVKTVEYQNYTDDYEQRDLGT